MFAVATQAELEILLCSPCLLFPFQEELESQHVSASSVESVRQDCQKSTVPSYMTCTLNISLQGLF